ncbi:hypothetical protein LKO27_10520 [Tessaracoccus sp. OS52]|uniref:hypothetical protein n=1 Tax=Tessaracoccus sp. OS52 TaxID=2886691 RepID=UPI001D0FE87D|nr:hypothetical protein [Tessaracoccus sp. OS52]MCC2593838.1 hypothetical protein [Tessaracoccus sp. OS52]
MLNMILALWLVPATPPPPPLEDVEFSGTPALFYWVIGGLLLAGVLGILLYGRFKK